MSKSILIVLLLTFLQFSGKAQTTCSSSFTVEKNDDSNSLSLAIETSGSYECSLLVFSDGRYIEVSQIKGSSGKEKFDNLEVDKIYLVRVEFLNEENFLCRVRKMGGIKI